MRCAAVVRDSRGAWLSATLVCYNYGSAFLTEILAVKLGIRHALDIGHIYVFCLSDCSQALQALHADTNITSYWTREKICRVHDIIATLQDVNLQHIDRVKNNTADKLVREAGRLEYMGSGSFRCQDSGRCLVSAILVAVTSAIKIAETTATKIAEAFASHTDLIDWARCVGKENGYVVIVIRSDYGSAKRKPLITLGCERGGKYKQRLKC
uniref:Pge1 protein n=1 Tax=Lotus japonicus TaxID=34305 RepID=O04180_LOTJA|nr:Pge1 protein [Lotus japonicus]